VLAPPKRFELLTPRFVVWCGPEISASNFLLRSASNCRITDIGTGEILKVLKGLQWWAL
jgi:hypothetical protein